MFRKLVNKWEFASIISPQTPKANNISCLYNNEYSFNKTHKRQKPCLKLIIHESKKQTIEGSIQTFYEEARSIGARTYAYPIAVRSRGINVLGS